MEGGLTNEFCEEHRIALFEVVEDLLKTDNFKVRIEPGSKKGKPIYLCVFLSKRISHEFSVQIQATISLESFIA